ncbi:MAG: hypothetical protein ACFFA0_05435 [Promethearchaeota archaeon]
MRIKLGVLSFLQPVIKINGSGTEEDPYIISPDIKEMTKIIDKSSSIQYFK